MTDNFEDNEHQETVHPEEGATTGAKSNLAEAWRTRPLFKLLVVMVVAGAVVALITSLLSGGKKEEMSRLINPPEMHEPPGGKISPYMLQQTKEAEAARAKEALAGGGSVMPTPIGQPSDINVVEKTDPMNELRVETEHLKQQISQMQLQQAQQQTKPVAAPTTPQQAPKPEPFDQNLSVAMQSQMKQLMDSWAPHGIKQTDFSRVAALSGLEGNDNNKGKEKYDANGRGQLIDQSSTPDAGNPEPTKPIINAGTISYAQMLTEANSDIPMPIMALIVSGPLNGAKAIGEFQVASGYGDYLVLHFKNADLKGKDYKIDAYALDPDTTFGGLVTESDQRYLTRLVLPAAASFLSGLGSAMGTVSSTTTTNGDATIISQGQVGVRQGVFQGLGQAATTAGSFFQEQANKVKPLVKVAANTPIGMFFVQSVCQWSMCGSIADNSNTNNRQQLPYGSQNPFANYGAGVGQYPGLGGASLGGYGGTSTDVPYPNYATPVTQSRSYGSPMGYGGSPLYGR